MGKIIALASGKGGVGKTTITASLGAALNRHGHKVLIADGDFGMRDLDLVLGLENEVLFDAFDLLKDRCFKADALISIADEFDLLAASQKKRWEDLGRKGYMKLLRKLAKKYDYILVDAPAGIGLGFENILADIDQLLVIVEPFWASLRDAERLMSICNKKRFFNYALVVNQMPYKKIANELTIEEILQGSLAEILGTILPSSVKVRRAVQNGAIGNLETSLDFVEMLEPLVSCLEERAWEEKDILLKFGNLSKNNLDETRQKSGSLLNRQRSARWRDRRRR